NAADPWVQASRISLHDLAGRPIKDVRRVRQILEKDLHPKHISELAGALATLDYKNGSVARAKRLFKLGSVEPSENMVAQLQCAHKQQLTGPREDLLAGSLAYEARASAAASKKMWAEAVHQCRLWLDDEPFSVRPANTGSFI